MEKQNGAEISSLHLERIEVRNYRNLEHLEVPRFSQVNLITGKNNAGKTSLLEAIYLLAGGGSPHCLSKIFYSRDYKFIDGEAEKSRVLENILEIFWDYSWLNNEIRNHTPESNSNLFDIISGGRYNISFRLIDNQIDGKQSIIVRLDHREVLASEIGDFFDIVIAAKEEKRLLLLPSDYISAQPRIELIDSSRYNKIQYSKRKREVINNALKILEPQLDFLIFDIENNEYKFVLVDEDVVPLLRYGDGSAKILIYALAMVNAENGVLVIDEFENGLHYTVQQQVWEFVFSLARELNVQVFATTHSKDTVESFGYVARENPGMGRVIRLYRSHDGLIKSVDFNEDEMATALESDIEMR